MPEMTFTVRWPDGAVQHCYSPSLVVHEHLQVGAEYPVDDFVVRARTALTEASDRVRAAYGFACTRAAASLAAIDAGATRRAALPGEQARVTVLAMHPPMPDAAPERSGRP